MVKKDRTHIYVTLSVTSILILFGIYTIISVISPVVDIPQEMGTGIPVIQPIPFLFCTITALIFCILLYKSNKTFNKEEKQ